MRKITTFFELAICIMATGYFTGCGALPTFSANTELRRQLDEVAATYDVARKRVIAAKAAGGIDDATWAVLTELDRHFADQWSLAVVRLNAGEDWRQTVGVIAEAVNTLLPVIIPNAGAAVSAGFRDVGVVAEEVADGKQVTRRYIGKETEE